MERYLNVRYVHRDIRSLRLPPPPTDIPAAPAGPAGPVPCPGAHRSARRPTGRPAHRSARRPTDRPAHRAAGRPADRRSAVAPALAAAAGAVLLGVALGLSILLLIAGVT